MAEREGASLSGRRACPNKQGGRWSDKVINTESFYFDGTSREDQYTIIFGEKLEKKFINM